MKIEPEVLFDKLASLELAEDIAAFCKEQGIKGVTQEDTSCVLARLFLRDTAVKSVKVGGEHMEWSTDEEPIEDWWERSGWGQQRVLTSAMEVFIRRFDSGQYPELVEPTPCWWEEDRDVQG